MTPREWLDGFHRGRCAARMAEAQANTRPTTNTTNTMIFDKPLNWVATSADTTEVENFIRSLGAKPVAVPHE